MIKKKNASIFINIKFIYIEMFENFATNNLCFYFIFLMCFYGKIKFNSFIINNLNYNNALNILLIKIL